MCVLIRILLYTLCTSCPYQTVQSTTIWITGPLKKKEVKASKLGSVAENLISCSQISTERREVKKKIKHLSNKARLCLTTKRKETDSNWQRVFNIWSLAASGSACCSGTAQLSCWASFAVLSAVLLITVIQDRLLSASIWLSLRWEFQNSQRKSNLPKSSERDAQRQSSLSVDEQKSSAMESSVTVYAFEKIFTPSNSKKTEIIYFTPQEMNICVHPQDFVLLCLS